MPTLTRPARKTNIEQIEKKLTSQRNELRIRMGLHRLDVVVEREPHDDAGQARDNSSQDILVATLELERQTLREIDSALLRIKKGEYGICASCGINIPAARLEALPWARLCVLCAEAGVKHRDMRAAS